MTDEDRKLFTKLKSVILKEGHCDNEDDFAYRLEQMTEKVLSSRDYDMGSKSHVWVYDVLSVVNIVIMCEWLDGGEFRTIVQNTANDNSYATIYHKDDHVWFITDNLDPEDDALLRLMV